MALFRCSSGGGSGTNIYMDILSLGVGGTNYKTITCDFKAKNIQIFAVSTSTGNPVTGSQTSPYKVFTYWDETNGCTGYQSDGSSQNEMIKDVTDTGFKFSPRWSNFTSTSRVFVLAAG